MPVPTPRCSICEEKVKDWNSQRGQHPKYCDKEECRRLGRIDPRCGRCKEPLTREHFSQRYHEECAAGCQVCGKPLRQAPKGKKQNFRNRPGRATTAGHLQPIYCSEECQEYAWKGDPLPICRICKETVPLPKPPQQLRNPPKMHRTCNRAQRQSAAEVEEEKLRALAASRAQAIREKRAAELAELKTPEAVAVDPAKAIRSRTGTAPKYPNPFEDDDPTP